MAAQHLLDGLLIELVDGDSNMINMPWTKATLQSLEDQLPSGKGKRIFVLSIMGVQSSGKSTLLNLMFGIQMRTSVGQCTRGVNMQLIPVQGRAEYDYILLLDTEGTRAPEYWGLACSEKRDNQMATLSILLADATIIVNPGENDAAIKEILPVVLLAYQGSKLAEEKGGRLSSMVFFVYNRIDTEQKDKLGNILQILSTSLHEAFHKVSELSETGEFNSSDVQSGQSSQKGMGLFRRFKLDASNSNESDIRVMGNIKKNFVPPEDVTDPAYGKALCEFREHIHSRVAGMSSSEQQWKSRSLNDIFEYLELVWLCIRSADFTLNFKTIVERASYDQLSSEYKRLEKELTDTFYDCNAQIEKELLAKKQEVQANDINFEALKLQFENLVREKELKLDGQVEEALAQPGRSNLKINFEHQWTKFKSAEKHRWTDRLRTFFQGQLKYDLHVAECKKQLRSFIRDMFADEKSKCWDENVKRAEFSYLFDGLLVQAQRDYPSLNVSDCIEKVYINSSRMKASQFDLLDKETIALARKDVDVLYGKSQSANSSGSILQSIQQVFSSGLNRFRKNNYQNCHQEMNQELMQEIVNCTQHAEVYMDPIVDKVIDVTVQITKKYHCSNSDSQYAHILAKILVTNLLEEKQKQWECVNSVSAKLEQPSTLQEMEAYYDSVSRGIKATELLVETLGANLRKILPEGFRKEIIRTVDLRLRTKTWLSDPKALQARLDLALL